MAYARDDRDLDRIEIELLMEGVYRHYGCDFRNYAYPSLRRRLWNLVDDERLGSISALQARVLHDPTFMEKLLVQLSINVTSMFRDPGFFLRFRQDVVPRLGTHPFVRLWHAGCSTGEEVYSMAILLEEAGLYDRCRIYATDMSEVALARARAGIYPIKDMAEYSGNYLRAGGTESLSRWYTANYDHAIFRAALKRNVVFSHHNLVTDGSFNEFNVILCRNVMIYFNTALQGRVHKLIHDSLRRFGILGLGRKETLRGTPHERSYESLDAEEKLYKKIE